MGPRVFSYRNFPTMAYALMSVPAVIFPIGPLLFLSRGRSPAPVEIVAILAAIGLFGVFFTFKHLLTWSNERIILTQDDICWYDSLGRLKVRSPVSGIVGGSLKGGMAFTLGVDGARSNQRAWSIDTSSGPIKFRSIISNCPDLVRELGRLGAMPEGTSDDRNLYLTCNYHTFAMVVGAIVGLAFAITAETVAYLNASGQVLDQDTGLPEPIWFSLIFALAGVGCLFLFVFCVMSFVNERITIAGDRILWHDKLGRDRVNCTSRDIVPGSYEARQRTDSHGQITNYFVYRVMTRMGPIKFDSNISHSVVLAEHFERLTDMTCSPVTAAAQVPDNRGWSADPLKDPDQSNIPIQ